MTGAAVRRLTLTDFRSYAFARLELTAQPVVLSGANGAGKTNLLEAVSLLVPGRGVRRARLSDLRRNESDAAWGIAARLDTPGGPVDIGTGSDGAGAEGASRRAVRINGIAAKSQTALADHASAIWLTPQMDRLFTEGAADRRRFLDRLVFGLDPAHAGRMSTYENALRQRASILRDGPRDALWLGELEETMAASGSAIAVARRAFVNRINGAMETARGGFPRARLDLVGSIDRSLAESAVEEAQRRFLEALAASRSRDGEMGGASTGPHRSDLAVTDRDRGIVAAQGSTGEQKALLVSIILATVRLLADERGTAPLVLLDEVAAHLDAERRRALFEEIVALGAQAWMTGTEIEIFTPFGSRAQFFRVQQGEVMPIWSGD